MVVAMLLMIITSSSRTHSNTFCVTSSPRHKLEKVQYNQIYHAVYSVKGSGRGLVVRVLDSRVVGSIPTPGMVRF